MFWNVNYVVAREISSLLKEENVTLTQLIEADDILQECQAENKALVQFLIKPDVISELVGLIVDEPSPDVELQCQYRYSNVACEILTSGIGAVNDRLSSDAVQMHRLCDFIAKEPPLNPLLASFFSKTVKALLEQSPKQDWYSYHIICLRVLDFLKSRADFLPNLFRHIGTSAIMDTFKYLIRLDLSSKIVLQWFEEHQFLEVLIQMICGTYVPEELAPPVATPAAPPPRDAPHEMGDAVKENGEHVELGHEESKDHSPDSVPTIEVTDTSTDSVMSRSHGSDKSLTYEVQMHASQVAAGRSANAANLMCEIILVGCYGEGGTRPTSGSQLMSQCKSERVINQLLQSMFTSPSEFRRDAVVNGVQVLLAALQGDPVDSEQQNAESRRAVVAAIAPHLPLLHQTLLQDPPPYPHLPQNRKIVGMARLQVATLIAALTVSPAEEVSGAIIALGTLSTLLDLFFACPGNNLLHAQTYRAISAALNNTHQIQYARHILIECDLLRRLMDAFEMNERREGGPARSGYMGHVILLLELLQQVLDSVLYDAAGVSDELGVRWAQFKEDRMQPLFRNTPLGGCHPADTEYEAETLAEANYDFPGVTATAVEEQELGVDDNATEDAFQKYYSNYHFQSEQLGGEGGTEVGERQGQQLDMFDDDDESKDWLEFNSCRRLPFDRAAPPSYPTDILDTMSPWESGGGGSSGPSEEGWAQFANAEDQEKFGTTLRHQEQFVPFWSMTERDSTSGQHSEPSSEATSGLQEAMQNLTVLDNQLPEPSTELVSNLLTAITSISPDALISLVDNQQSPEPMDQRPDSPEGKETPAER